MKRHWFLALLAASACSNPSASPEVTPGALQVFAAMSLKEPVEQLALEFENQRRSRVDLQFGGSNLLAQQIDTSRTQDAYFSADEHWMQYLVQRGVASARDVARIASNSLVVVARRDAPFQPVSLAQLGSSEIEHIVTGDPRGVPVGRYAKAGLEHAGVWNALESKIMPTSNVRAALALAASDPRTVGIVYRTDVAIEPDLQVLFEIATDPRAAIGYYASSLSRATTSEPTREAKAFIDFCLSARGHDVLRRHGFAAP